MNCGGGWLLWLADFVWVVLVALLLPTGALWVVLCVLGFGTLLFRVGCYLFTDVGLLSLL